MTLFAPITRATAEALAVTFPSSPAAQAGSTAAEAEAIAERLRKERRLILFMAWFSDSIGCGWWWPVQVGARSITGAC
jgi:hypothetical protein